MKILNFIKNNKLISFVSLVYLILLIFNSDKFMESISNSSYYLLEMIQILPAIFLLTAIIDTLIPKKVIVNRMGENSGFSGYILSLVLGSISAGPIYAAFPIAKTLLSKGAGISNIVIILSAWAVVKVPMLLNEVKFLGIDFMIVRWILTVIAIFTMGYITSRIVKKEDLPKEKSNSNEGILKINDDYCIGCGLCVKTLPEIYEMKNKKAIVKNSNPSKKVYDSIDKTIQKCPTQAIKFK
ncbi:permease [Clostridium sp. D2Q-14]|uniref:permease n=1 Tax=Anaeromonas gelatinilytica TaxID=2683194 RepID=UPI00193BEA7E|nr:permease [Anaeromonas gelatinilytica]MBS4536463.1 permease [Anaeromonas gelatinilytica]